MNWTYERSIGVKEYTVALQKSGQEWRTAIIQTATEEVLEAWYGTYDDSAWRYEVFAAAAKLYSSASVGSMRYVTWDHTNLWHIYESGEVATLCYTKFKDISPSDRRYSSLQMEPVCKRCAAELEKRMK